MKGTVNLKIWLVTTVLLSAMAGTTFGGKIIYVDADANGLNNGSSWTDAYKYLQDGLRDATSAEKPVEIRVAQGIYKPDEDIIHPAGTGDRTAAFQLINGVAVKAGYAGFGEPNPDAREITVYESILSGDLAGNDVQGLEPSELLNHPSRGENSYNIFYHPEGLNLDGSAILDGFTITSGNANLGWPHWTGGMYNSSSSPTVNNCAFRGNSATEGGGMYNYKSRPTVTNCTFSGNSATERGSGMYNIDSTPIVTNCTFSGNSAHYGGGMYNDEESYTHVTACTFSGNMADDGGGMCNRGRSSPTLEGCTFSGNAAGRDGGGMYNYYYSSPTLTNCTFSGNSGRSGGGMCNYYYSSPSVSNCTLTGNSAGWSGGGMCNYNCHSSLTVEACTFTANSADDGGGMYNSHSSLTVEACTFSENSAKEQGGAICNYNSEGSVTNCSFMGNSSSYGGAMYNYDSSPNLKNCLFAANSAWVSGGGISNFVVSDPTVTNCTFSGNSANESGGGIYNSCYHTLLNCIVQNSVLWSDIPNEIYIDGIEPEVIYTNVKGGWPGEGNINADPCFVREPNDGGDGWGDDLGTPDVNEVANDDYGDLHLRPDSPCINEGTEKPGVGLPETDMDGEARVMWETVDMGADEFNPIRFVDPNRTRISRTEFVYDCNVSFTNLWPFAIENVQLEMLSGSDNMDINEPNVSFGDTEFRPRESITSIDTCTFKVDRSQAIEPAQIIWRVNCTRADTGMPLELTIGGVGSAGLKGVSSELKAAEKNDFLHLAGLSGQWLWTGPAGGIAEDTVPDGTVNLADFARLAQQWATD